MLSLKKELQLLSINQKYKVPLRSLKNVSMFCSPVEHIKIHSFIALKIFSSFSGKVSLCVSRGLRAGMTVEAAVVLPFFLMIILSLISFLEIIQLQNGITMGLREAGRPMSVYGYAYHQVQESKDLDFTGIVPNLVFSYGYAGKKVKEFLGEDYLDRSPLANGADSIQYYNSSIMDESDVIDLVAVYVAELDFNVGLVPKMRLSSRYYGRAWTGYDLAGNVDTNSSEINVYVTPEGSVYHMSRYCTHLQLTILSCPFSQVQEKRNEDGSRYKACMRCGSNYSGRTVFITSDGDRYHGSIKCSGLKRTIDVIPISRVGERRRCSRCGG